MTKSGKNGYGFTIIELLVVVVIIGILAAITVVGYIGFQNKAVAATLESDLDNGSKQLKLFQITNKNYPTSVDDCPSPGVDNICLKFSPGNTLVSYVPDNVSRPRTFSLTIENVSHNLKYTITNNTTPAQIIDIVCPTGFIVVPGSATYGTSDFCVMKYEAKMADSTTPVSQVEYSPWLNINQDEATSYSPNVAGCSDCHLITEAEWLTIAQNVLSVPSNWDNGAGVHSVGVGYIYSGHNDASPNNSLDASTNDSDGYYGTENSAPSNQRRTLTLTNGEVIWDLAGNGSEWTSGQVTSGQPGIAGAGYAFREWPALTTIGTISPNIFPSGTGISGASSWNSSNGIGQVYTNSDATTLRAFVRGGNFNYGNIAGVMSFVLLYDNTAWSLGLGFRVASPAQ